MSTQRHQVETLLLEGGSSGVHSFELYRLLLPRSAVVIDRLRKAGWQIDSVPEPSPGGGQGCRYILRSTPGDGHQVAEAIDDAGEQIALLPPPASPSTSAVYDDWDA